MKFHWDPEREPFVGSLPLVQCVSHVWRHLQDVSCSHRDNLIFDL
jgi:hypothetical protein